MLEYGKVARIKDGEATISFCRRGECDKCRLCEVTKDGASCVLKLPNSLDVAEGDFVKVKICKTSLWRKWTALYFLPLALTAIGAGVGTLMSAGASAILAVAGLVAGLAFAVPIDVCVLRKRKGFKPYIAEMCTEAEYQKNKALPVKNDR